MESHTTNGAVMTWSQTGCAIHSAKPRDRIHACAVSLLHGASVLYVEGEAKHTTYSDVTL